MAQRMAGRFEARPLAAINVTPLVPVLLAIFAVLAATAGGPGKPVNLYVEPGSVPPPYDALHPLPPRVFISLERDGVHVGPSEAMTLEQAVSLAAPMTRAQGADVIMVRADIETPYSEVMGAVRALNAAGLKAEFLNEDLH
ncbi:ExbD/TolR family protein [Caulobacter sp. HMWF025]|uniref:ExbD/TolR family protein n=1 Tax=Caulobacter sp. HMWF025 TaxID=2056860 RepID=UPI000D3D80AD|nr:hypothetical protein [Caulobacter sp. HMWF025]